MTTQSTEATVCLSFDFDAMSSWIFRGQVSPTPLSRGSTAHASDCRACSTCSTATA
ncbi:MAG: hypothetical protein U0531_20135 [Dehalococcoidia bacterium]